MLILPRRWSTTLVKTRNCSFYFLLFPLYFSTILFYSLPAPCTSSLGVLIWWPLPHQKKRGKAMEIPSSDTQFPPKSSNFSCPPDSLWIPSSPPSSMFLHHDSSSPASMVEFEGGDKTVGDEEMDGGSFVRPEKKRRLKPDQVRALEEIFEVESKLEASRKLQLAQELGLHPRQVSIWFQNRRARCKSKLLEKEYNALKAKYDKLKADHDAIFAKNQELREEVKLLTQKLIPAAAAEEEEEAFPSPAGKTSSPDAAASSVKSDVIDSESSGGNRSPFSENSDSSRALKRNDEDENMSFLQPLLSFPKLEAEGFEDLQPNSCNLGFPVQFQGTWLWRY